MALLLGSFPTLNCQPSPCDGYELETGDCESVGHSAALPDATDSVAVETFRMTLRHYLRTLLIHGARSVIQYAERKADESSWLRKLMATRNNNVAAVALANKNARTIWALLAHDRMFRPDYLPVAAA